MFLENVARSRRVPGDALRDAALVAGVGLAGLLPTNAVRAVPRPLLIVAGLLGAVAMVVLAHLAGADMRAGYSGSQPGLLPKLLVSALSQDAPALPPT
jgi:tetrahydromethanopterin S-methyltransferase subunit D